MSFVLEENNEFLSNGNEKLPLLANTDSRNFYDDTIRDRGDFKVKGRKTIDFDTRKKLTAMTNNEVSSSFHGIFERNSNNNSSSAKGGNNFTNNDSSSMRSANSLDEFNLPQVPISPSIGNIFFVLNFLLVVN